MGLGLGPETPRMPQEESAPIPQDPVFTQLLIETTPRVPPDGALKKSYRIVSETIRTTSSVDTKKYPANERNNDPPARMVAVVYPPYNHS